MPEERDNCPTDADKSRKNWGSFSKLIHQKKDGSLFPVEVSARAITVDEKKYFQSIIRDISERKRASDALRESEERFRRTLDDMLEGCQIVGFDGRYLYVNNAVAIHGHLTKDALLGRTMMEVYPGIENSEMFVALRRCMQERRSHPDGQ